jgi:hypothetical protein
LGLHLSCVRKSRVRLVRVKGGINVMDQRPVDALSVIFYMLFAGGALALFAYAIAAGYDLWQEHKERKRRRKVRRIMNRCRERFAQWP